jgi:hypothetical protein
VTKTDVGATEIRANKGDGMKRKILGVLAMGLLAGPMAANSVPYQANIFVRGSFNDWSANPGNVMSYDAPSETYQATLLVVAGFHNFRIASNDWSINIGSLGGSPLVQLNVPRQLTASDASSNLEIALTATGNYSFLLDTRSGLDAPTLLVKAREAAEPGTLALLGLGLAGLGLSRRRMAS